ncbi:DUF427 domain-containing protein [Actinacidiphila paucisporea]|uniref:Uncharacterized conserved protein, DUF427 family n=1 Tax=Actinacidiphila paucisporea TaxID=310782 RepID=A0A1M7P072_9ACTN|nr:DUF427 domain-containing protein [Actinacidiphila paucisporea]SHN09842.1 Uncharacterized conserved protein, DUF427 family [Actinacidiphila paucisporea]
MTDTETGTDPASGTAKRRSVRVEPSARRVRVFLGGQIVAESTRALMVWESPHYPVYYFPPADVREDLLSSDGTTRHSPRRGDGRKHTVRVGDIEAPGAAMYYGEDALVEEIRGFYRFEFGAMDSWFEEDEEIFVHVRDPYTRIEILPTSRPVRIEVGGVTIAESTSARMLIETGVPIRYYLPKTHVRMDLLEPSDTSTGCPYKGTAQYWSVRVGDTLHKDIAWSYRTPTAESQKIAGLIAFYRVDIYVDGVLHPETPRPRALS